jgi:hypothetical protein
MYIISLSIYVLMNVHVIACPHHSPAAECFPSWETWVARGDPIEYISICELIDLSALTSDHKSKMELRLDQSLLNPLRTNAESIWPTHRNCLGESPRAESANEIKLMNPTVYTRRAISGNHREQNAQPEEGSMDPPRKNQGGWDGSFSNSGYRSWAKMARSIDLPFGIHCWSNNKNKKIK